MKFIRFLLLPLYFFCSSALLGFSQPDPAKITDFARDIAPLLRDKCVSCHEGEKAKNGFVVGDRDALMAFVEPGNADSSSLWTDYLHQPSRDQLADSLVMPPDGGPLNAAQLAIIKLWIDEGAIWPEGMLVHSHEKEPPTIQIPGTISISVPTKLYRAIGYFHPAMVHFPIALFFVGGACAFLSYFLGPRCQTTAFQCVALAAVTSILTVIMGWSFAQTKGYPPWYEMLAVDATHDQENLFYHRWIGTFTAVFGLGCVLLGLIARRYKSDNLNHAWRIGAILLAALVGIVGHQGGELVYGDIFDKAMEQLQK
ncbi:MAG TPA: DUF2231 domain-containing protein [Pirellula sp.]|nr:DUF2231 domain-containing protein [Pirellula sp.]